MPKVALIGPGAIGGTLASFLLENPENDVSIYARSAFESLSVSFEGKESLHHPKVHTSVSKVTPVDWIILATKTYQIEQAAPWLPNLSHGQTRLAVVQNGVEHLENLTPYFDQQRIVPVIIDCPAQRLSQGKILRFGQVSMRVPSSTLSQAFAQLFKDPNVTIEITDDWTSAAWRKLAINCAGAICALVDQPANIAKDPRAQLVMESLIRECIEVGTAEGATLDDSIIEPIIKSQAEAPEDSINSLHADFIARRPMEWDARNGIIARKGEKHGLATPYNKMAATLLSLLESKHPS